MVAKDPDGNNLPVPGLIVEDREGVRRFTRSKFRKEQAFDRDSRFESKTFDPGKYATLLEGENIRIRFK